MNHPKFPGETLSQIRIVVRTLMMRQITSMPTRMLQQADMSLVHQMRKGLTTRCLGFIVQELIENVMALSHLRDLFLVEIIARTAKRIIYANTATATNQREAFQASTAVLARLRVCDTEFIEKEVISLMEERFPTGPSLYLTHTARVVSAMWHVLLERLHIICSFTTIVKKDTPIVVSARLSNTDGTSLVNSRVPEYYRWADITAVANYISSIHTKYPALTAFFFVRFLWATRRTPHCVLMDPLMGVTSILQEEATGDNNSTLGSVTIVMHRIMCGNIAFAYSRWEEAIQYYREAAEECGKIHSNGKCCPVRYQHIRGEVLITTQPARACP